MSTPYDPKMDDLQETSEAVYQSAIADWNKTATESIDIIVEGGVIQDILNIPKGVSVRVIDYDIDGADPERLSRSPYDDNEAIISEY